MKDWYIPLSELTNGQVTELFNLANLAGLGLIPTHDTDMIIGAYKGDFSTWRATDGKQITYKQAVKKLRKLIDENDFNDTVKEMTSSTAELHTRCVINCFNPERGWVDSRVKVDKLLTEEVSMRMAPEEGKAKKHIIEAAKAMGIKPEDLE